MGARDRKPSHEIQKIRLEKPLTIGHTVRQQFRNREQNLQLLSFPDASLADVDP